MRWLRALASSRRGRIVLAAVACYLLWQAWLTLRAPAKIAPGLEGAAGAVDVQVILRFPPERFHVLVFQRYGRVSGTEDNRVELRGVRPPDLAAVARPFWVARVEPIEREAGRDSK
ncbi:MAG TPA: hypothetical protein VFN71_07430 [Methylomirabilota bacterium]|nr:hypothetical protein [Methylomirabilota bacterium]